MKLIFNFFVVTKYTNSFNRRVLFCLSYLPVLILRLCELILNLVIAVWYLIFFTWSKCGSSLNSVLNSLYVLSLGYFVESCINYKTYPVPILCNFPCDNCTVPAVFASVFILIILSLVTGISGYTLVSIPNCLLDLNWAVQDISWYVSRYEAKYQKISRYGNWPRYPTLTWVIMEVLEVVNPKG